MSDHAEKLTGAFLPVTTPFHEDMSVDYDALKWNMRFYAQSGIHGFLALGSNGENRCLREDEKRAVLDVILENKSSNQVVMTGCIYDSTPLTVEFMQHAKQAGSDFATLLSPSYFRKQMTHEILVDYFTECAESVDIPVLLYNAPGFTGITLAPETVAELSKHPNIVGMKDSAPSGIENFCRYNCRDFCVMAGSAGFFYSSMVDHGVRGGIVSLGNVFPEVGLTLWKNGMRGKDEEGIAYENKMREANRKISGTYGVPGVKAAMEIAGLKGRFPRKPLKKLNEADRENIRKALVEAGLL